MCVELCMLRNKFLTRERTLPTHFLSVHSCEHGWKRSGRARGNDSGMYKAGFADDDAPRAVPSDARHQTEKLASHIRQRNSGLRLRSILIRKTVTSVTRAKQAPEIDGRV